MKDARELVQRVTSSLRDPVSGASVASAGLVKAVAVDGPKLSLKVEFTPQHDDQARERITGLLRQKLAEGGWDGPVQVVEVSQGGGPEAPSTGGEGSAPRGGAKAPHGGGLPEKKPIPGVRHVVAVASGKGGVGKSTVAVQLACGLRDLGHATGIMDADIYGPSLPILLGTNAQPQATDDNRIIPVEARGLRTMSIGYLLGQETPLVWRGPMVMSVVRQFIEEVEWGPLDYLVVDLPPGTGDAQLTMVQMVPISGAVIVSTPQALALADALRAMQMFNQLDVPILGLVENMAWYELPDGGRDHPFGEGGAAKVAKARGVDLLAQVPLDGRIRAAGDAGDPSALGSGTAQEAFRAMAAAVARKIPV